MPSCLLLTHETVKGDNSMHESNNIIGLPRESKVPFQDT